jgi:uncharacterized protein
MIQNAEENLWGQLVSNRVLLASVTGWAVAQFLKVLLGIITERRFNFKWFVGSGGMPSSHAATVMALAVAVGLTYNFASPYFAITAIFAFIIMFDAQGVRRQSGKQAEALNHILDDLHAQRGIKPEPLKELFGHTPVEVMAGAIIGVLMAFLIVGRG